MRGKQINFHQNYPVDCFSEYFHFSVNYSLTAGLAAERHRVCHTSFVKLNTFLSFSLAEEALYMTFQPPCQPLRQDIQWFLSSGGTLPLMEAVWFWVAQLARIGLIPSISFYVCFWDCVSNVEDTRGSTHRNQGNLCTWHQCGIKVACQSGLLQTAICCSNLTALSILHHRPWVSWKCLIILLILEVKFNSFHIASLSCYAIVALKWQNALAAVVIMRGAKGKLTLLYSDKVRRGRAGSMGQNIGV